MEATSLPLGHGKMASEHKPFWKRMWQGKDDREECVPQQAAPRPGVARRISRKVVPGLQRPGTFKRQQSELRDRLEPVKQDADERRALSVDRRRYVQSRGTSGSVVPPMPRRSAPEGLGSPESGHSVLGDKQLVSSIHVNEVLPGSDSLAPPARPFLDSRSASVDTYNGDVVPELDSRWILNLSMHFRDRSSREKFFVTFAETPSRWRRVTVSLDYRQAPPGSLEEDLQGIRFQRDKSSRIFESIRESLMDIQFYDTVTNLKLQTDKERLHVHVTEDVHEIIHYPPVSSVSHLECQRFPESALSFDAHLSGFVYRVKIDGKIFIKKEIPGPDTVEEFLYEINALHRLSGSQSVIEFGGVVLDNDKRLVKGLLISFAEQGALIEMIYEGKGQMPWKRRERWAKQIVQGLSEIHEAGYVQGDFTLSNIVVDANDDAKIIDINRRGCPMGWEPPELAALIKSDQRISMYIGVKSDIFQLGMVLWAIAMEEDEPEMQSKPLVVPSDHADVPAYYRELIANCLSDNPRDRSQASTLLASFPEICNEDAQPYIKVFKSPSNSMEKQYIDPATAVERDDIEFLCRSNSAQASGVVAQSQSNATHTYVDAPTDISGEQYFYPQRGRSTSPKPTNEVIQNSQSEAYELDTELADVDSPEIITVSPPSGGQHASVYGIRQLGETHTEGLRQTAAAPVQSDAHRDELRGIGGNAALQHAVDDPIRVSIDDDDDDFTTDMHL